MTNQCTICPVGCAVCISSLNCSVCRNVSGLFYYLLNNSCSINCPLTQYEGFNNYSNPICIACISPCQNCNGNISCLSCVNGYNLIYGTDICNQSCPDGQFANNSICLLCSINCVTCSTSAGKCGSCGLSVYGLDLYLHSFSCIAVCPVHFFANITSHNCDTCDSSCYTCTGPTPNNCTSCNSGSL
jgi:proprotein convertase subtilisin/kexin type 5